MQTNHQTPLIVIVHDIEPGQETFEESFSGGLVQVRYAWKTTDESMDDANECILQGSDLS